MTPKRGRPKKFDRQDEEAIAAAARSKGVAWAAESWNCSERLVYSIMDKIPERSQDADQDAPAEMTPREAGDRDQDTREASA